MYVLYGCDLLGSLGGKRLRAPGKCSQYFAPKLKEVADVVASMITRPVADKYSCLIRQVYRWVPVMAKEGNRGIVCKVGVKSMIV